MDRKAFYSLSKWKMGKEQKNQQAFPMHPVSFTAWNQVTALRHKSAKFWRWELPILEELSLTGGMFAQI